MSTTINSVLLDHHWRENGTNFYRLLVIHNRKKKYLKTNIVVSKSDLGRGGKVKTLSVATAIGDLVLKVRKIVSEINMFTLDSMTVDEVVAYIESKMKEPGRFELDFYEYGLQVASKKSASTAHQYRTALNALLRFFNSRHPDISEITVRKLRAFEEFIRNEGVVSLNRFTGETKESKKKKKARTPAAYMADLRHVYRSAREEYNDPDLGIFPLPVNPFEYYAVPRTPATRHRNISVDVIQKMIDTRLSLSGRARLGVDVFLISFGLCGMNLADMFTCEKPMKNDILHYYRQKTTSRRDDAAEMWIKVFPCIRQIMDEYRGEGKCFNFSSRYASKKVFNDNANCGLRQWQKENGTEDFTLYSARHSWATIARSKQCNIDAKIVTAGLCHIGFVNKTDDIYVNFDWELLWDAQKKILDVFKWE